jgi:hypothetical protein
MRIKRNKNGIIRSNKYASQGDSGGRLGKYIASDIILTDTPSTMNVTPSLSRYSR